MQLCLGLAIRIYTEFYMYHHILANASNDGFDWSKPYSSALSPALSL